MIKYKDKILYIAECKIWRDEKYFIDGIDQLLNYLGWRDSKTSYIVFSKNINVTRVISNTKRLTESHSNFIRKESDISESCIRYMFRHKADTSKECFLTLHVFDLGVNK